MSGLKRTNRGRSGHSYKDDDGPLDGVTTILKDAIAKPALINWAASKTAEYAIDNWTELSEQPLSVRLDRLKKAKQQDLDQASGRGTEVHTIAEHLVRHEEVEVPEALAGHAEAYVKFLDQFKPEPIAVEISVANTAWRYAGTSDGFFRFPNGKTYVVDLKTTRSGIFGEVALQLAAYRHAEYGIIDGKEVDLDEFDLDPDIGLAIHVRSDGVSVHPLPVGDDSWTAFRHCVRVARWSRTSRDLVGAELEPAAVGA